MKALALPTFGFSLSLLLVLASGGVLLAQNNQGSPWGTVISPKQYVHPDTGQSFCFYSSSTWAPCPGQGYAVIQTPPGGQCADPNGGMIMRYNCPAEKCAWDGIRAAADRLTAADGTTALPCNGLPRW